MNTRLLKTIMLCSVFALTAACSSDDDDGIGVSYKLYFSQDGNGNGLYTINTSTGEATIVGSGISGVTSSTVGLAYDFSSKTLFGSKWSTLLDINLDGSGATDLGGIGNEALAFDDDTNTLYGCLNGACRTINTADGTQVAAITAPGSDVEGLAVDPATGNVYGITRGAGSVLMSYNPNTTAWTTIGALGVDMFDPGLAYQPAKKLLYAINDTGTVYTIDPATGAATVVGSTGLGNTNGGGLTVVKSLYVY